MPLVSNGHYQKINSHYSNGSASATYATVLPSSNIQSNNTPRSTNNYVQQPSKYVVQSQSSSSPRMAHNYDLAIDNYAQLNTQHYQPPQIITQQHYNHYHHHNGNYQKAITLQQASPSLNNSNEYG